MPKKSRLSIAQAASILGTSRQAVHNAIRQKRLKAKKGTFVVERIVKTKMSGWTIDPDDLELYRVSAMHQEAGKKND